MYHPLGIQGWLVGVRIPGHESSLFFFSLSIFCLLNGDSNTFPSSERQEKNLTILSLWTYLLAKQNTMVSGFTERARQGLTSSLLLATSCFLLLISLQVSQNKKQSWPYLWQSQNFPFLSIPGPSCNSHMRLAVREAHRKGLKLTLFLVPVHLF